MTMHATVTPVGGPTLLLDVAGVRLLTDPTLDDAGGTYSLGPVTLVKTSAPALSPGQLGLLDVVLLTHDQHPDNLDRAGRALLAEVPLVLTTPAAAARLGANAVGLRPGDTVEVCGASGRVTVTATEAVHGPTPLLPVLGEVTGFLVTAPDRASIYVGGDNVSLDGVVAATERADIALAVLHGGAARLPAFGPTTLSFSVADLVEAARLLGRAPVLVVHDDGWNHLTEHAEEVAAAFAAAGLLGRLLRVEPGRSVPVALPPAATSGPRAS